MKVPGLDASSKEAVGGLLSSVDGIPSRQLRWRRRWRGPVGGGGADDNELPSNGGRGSDDRRGDSGGGIRVGTTTNKSVGVLSASTAAAAAPSRGEWGWVGGRGGGGWGHGPARVSIFQCCAKGMRRKRKRKARWRRKPAWVNPGGASEGGGGEGAMRSVRGSGRRRRLGGRHSSTTALADPDAAPSHTRTRRATITWACPRPRRTRRVGRIG